MTKEKFNAAEFTLVRGEQWPYDGAPQFDGDAVIRQQSKDWAHRAARGILYDLNDRAGIKHAFKGVYINVRVDIVDALATIIRTAEVDRRKAERKAK